MYLYTGVSVLHFGLVYGASGGDTGAFLQYYSPLALVCQHMYFLFSTVSLIGAMDRFFRDRALGKYANTYVFVSRFS